MASSDKKIAEGLAHLREAEKHLKTGIFKWKPDYDSAVSEYNKAAVAFKNAKAHEQAINSYIKTSDIHRQTGSLFHAAKAMESAALILKEIKDFQKSSEFIEKASNMYIEHGTRDTAAILLDRSAKMLAQNMPQEAIRLYMKAADIYEVEDNPRQVAEMTGKAGRIQLRLRHLDEAAETLVREIDFYNQVDNQGLVPKLVLGLVLTHLHRGDYVAAQQAFRTACDYAGFSSSEEAGPIEDLLAAYDEGDQEKVSQIARCPLFRYMENEFTKLARDLVVTGDEIGSANTGSAGGVSPGNDEDDPYAEGLL